MEGPEAADPNDPAVGVCEPPPNRDYTTYLDAGALGGARIGIPRAFYYDAVTPPGAEDPRGRLSPEARALMDEAIAVLRDRGAVIVDPAVIPSHVATDPGDNQLLFGNCYDTKVRGKDADCSVVMKYGMKRDFNAWLASLGDTAPVPTLAALRAFNESHPQRSWRTPSSRPRSGACRRSGFADRRGGAGGGPATCVRGKPPDRCTSTMTCGASTPTQARLWIWASPTEFPSENGLRVLFPVAERVASG